MEDVVTPRRLPTQETADRTRPQDPESPSQTNLRTSRRKQKGPPPAAVRFSTGGGASNRKQGVDLTEALSRRINDIQKATDERHHVVISIATALEACMATFTSPTETAI